MLDFSHLWFDCGIICRHFDNLEFLWFLFIYVKYFTSVKSCKFSQLSKHYSYTSEKYDIFINRLCLHNYLCCVLSSVSEVWFGSRYLFIYWSAVFLWVWKLWTLRLRLYQNLEIFVFIDESSKSLKRDYCQVCTLFCIDATL